MARNSTSFAKGNAFRWRPGRSANPGGMYRVREMIARRTKNGDELIDFMYSIFKFGLIPIRSVVKNEEGQAEEVDTVVTASRDQMIEAHNWLAANIFGRPKTAEDEGPPPPAAFDFTRLDEEERGVLRRLLEKSHADDGEDPAPAA